MILVDTYKLGALKTNCYLIKDVKTGKMAIIDPGGISRKLDDTIKQFSKEDFCYILLTHGHFDHIRKAQRYKELTDSKVVISKDEKDFLKEPKLNLSYQFGKEPLFPFEADILVHEGDVLDLGDSQIKVIKTPGHTVGSVCYLVDDCIFTGDTLMKGSVGRTDLATGNTADMDFSLKILGLLNGDYKIYPGHGEPTTLNEEKNSNPYFKSHNFNYDF